MSKKLLLLLIFMLLIQKTGLSLIGSAGGPAPVVSQSGAAKLGSAKVLGDFSVGLLIQGREWLLNLPPGATVNDALEAVANIKHGVVCCDSRDIQCINGLCQDPYHDAWWVIKVNGNSQNHSSHSRLSPGDVVELIYSKKLEHQALQDWLLSFSKGK